MDPIHPIPPVGGPRIAPVASPDRVQALQEQAQRRRREAEQESRRRRQAQERNSASASSDEGDEGRPRIDVSV